MFSGANHILGMHVFWWFIWVALIVWIFAIPYDIPGQRRKKDSALDLLQKRFTAGQITEEEFKERKIILEA